MVPPGGALPSRREGGPSVHGKVGKCDDNGGKQRLLLIAPWPVAWPSLVTHSRLDLQVRIPRTDIRSGPMSRRRPRVDLARHMAQQGAFERAKVAENHAQQTAERAVLRRPAGKIAI